MHVNRTGAGFHRDSRREGRMSRGALKRTAIEEDFADLDRLDELEDPWSWGDSPLLHIDYSTTTQED